MNRRVRQHVASANGRTQGSGAGVLNNLINRHDVWRLYRKLRQGEVSRILEKLRVRGPDRVLAHWSDATAPDGMVRVSWTEIPAVRRRWHTVAGDGQEISFPQHAAATWLAGRPGLRALSLGCGTGDGEIEWARLGVFGHITGIDVSPERIDQAARQAKEAGLEDVLSFRAADARQVLREGEQFDVVLALQSLHHFEHAAETMKLIAGCSAPAACSSSMSTWARQGSSGPGGRCGRPMRCSRHFQLSGGGRVTAGSSTG